MGDVLEIGWKLSFETWGHGYASEAARASLDWLFANSAEPEVWAISVTSNLRSRAVMGRLGMTHDPALDFDHPRIAEGDPLRRHVTYSISREAWGRK